MIMMVAACLKMVIRLVKILFTEPKEAKNTAQIAHRGTAHTPGAFVPILSAPKGGYGAANLHKYTVTICKQASHGRLGHGRWHTHIQQGVPLPTHWQRGPS